MAVAESNSPAIIGRYLVSFGWFCVSSGVTAVSIFLLR